MTTLATPMLTLREVAEYLRLHYNQVQKMAKARELPVMKIGAVYRVRPADLAEWERRQLQCCGHNRMEDK